MDMRALAARVAASSAPAVDEMKRVIADLRAAATITPAKRPEELEAGWADRFLALVEQLRLAVPEEWTAEELEDQIARAVVEVRAAKGCGAAVRHVKGE